jgi:hypothetical protein
MASIISLANAAKSQKKGRCRGNSARLTPGSDCLEIVLTEKKKRKATSLGILLKLRLYVASTIQTYRQHGRLPAQIVKIVKLKQAALMLHRLRLLIRRGYACTA